MVQTTPFKTRGEAQTAATWGIKPGAPPSTKIRKFTAYRNPAGTLLGFLSIELPSGLIINDAKLMIGQAGKHWIALPATKQLDKDGNPRLDVNGKAMWQPIIEFASRAARDRLQDQVFDAMRRTHPEIFVDEGGQ